MSSLYIHFPFCRHLCNYCDFFKSVAKSQSDILNFQTYLEKNIENLLALAERENYTILPLETLYIGGGTPSLWGASGAYFLKELLKKYGLTLAPEVEATLEVNPGSWTHESLVAFRDFGINRFSLGIQSLNGEYLKILDRVHNLDDVFHTLEYFNRHDLNFSTDLMLGLPYSQEFKRNVINELENILSFNPSHLSVYILTIKNNYVHLKNMPIDDLVGEEYLDVANFLKNKNFVHYEVSNFAKYECESAHNMKYWNSQSVLALGPSATGFLRNSRLRFKAKTRVPDFDYELLSEDSFKLESVYMGLRIHQFFDLAPYIAPNAWSGVSQVIDEWSEKKMLQKNSFNHIRMTSEGFLQLDSFMDSLFIYGGL